MTRSGALNRREFGIALASGFVASGIRAGDGPAGGSRRALQALDRHRRAVQSRLDERVMAAAGSALAKAARRDRGIRYHRDQRHRQRRYLRRDDADHRALDGRSRSLSHAHLDRPPALRYRPREEGQRRSGSSSASRTPRCSSAICRGSMCSIGSVCESFS